MQPRQIKQNTKKNKQLSVISLNYSGILLSPFEFFSGQSPQMTAIQTNLSNIYKRLLKDHSDDFSQNKKQNKFKWSLGKIDQKMQTQRYSPLYMRDAGIEQNNRLMGEDEFIKEWEYVFNQNILVLKKKDPGFKYTNEEMEQAKKFDLLCYKCILLHVYPNLKSFEKKILQGLGIQKYKKFMDRMFNKSFLNDEKKLKKTLDSIVNEKVDIAFVQEANQSLINRLRQMNGYKVFTKENSESIIIVRRIRFDYIFTEESNPFKLQPEIEKELAWNDDTVVASIHNLILISGHLSSKKDKNPQQVHSMMQSLSKLHSIYPKHHIIVGCDANSFVPNTLAQYCSQNKIQCACNQNDKNNKQSYYNNRTNKCSCYKPQNWIIYPTDPLLFTTSKKRTYLQPQVNKAQEVAQVCRDHLIILKANDIYMEKQNVCTILNKSQKEVSNLPCEEHPYDHYVVKAVITEQEKSKHMLI